MTRQVGYSGKPLVDKLGVRSGDVLATVNAPPNYDALLSPLPGGARRCDAEVAGAQIVHLFVRSRAELETAIGSLLEQRPTGAMVWISWPKKSSAMFVDLTEDGVREIVLSTGWVDVKVCAVDADWSGLKFLRRRT